ncbi:MAG: TetR/AcrR family transcriptional regulator [Oscillospiraceae bacterium]|nr:TetR/AcrR family transcriptional regulator [Oscillospiraceae bacterium]
MDYAGRRKLQAKQTEQSILQAALTLSREKSFDKVSVRDICRAAGITTGAFYHHFKSKEELLSKGFAPLDSHMEHALAGHEGDPPEQRLWTILWVYAQFIERQGWELVSRYYQRRLASPNVLSMDPSRYTLQAMLQCLQEAQKTGLLSQKQSPEWVADFLFRHFRGMVIDWIIHRGTYPLWPKLEQDYLLFHQLFRAAPICGTQN